MVDITVIFLKTLFISLRKRESEHERGKVRGKSRPLPSREPHAGLDPKTSGS